MALLLFPAALLLPVGAPSVDTRFLRLGGLSTGMAPPPAGASLLLLPSPLLMLPEGNNCRLTLPLLATLWPDRLAEPGGVLEAAAAAP